MYKGKLRKEFVDIFSNILKNMSSGKEFRELVFRIGKDDFKMHAMNNARCMQFVGIFSYDDVFESVESKDLDKELVYSMKADLLTRIINKMKGDSLTMLYNEGKVTLENNKGKFIVPALEPNENDMDLKTPNLIFNTELAISPPLFFSTLDTAKVVKSPKDDVSFKLIFNEGKFSIQTQGTVSESTYKQVFNEEEVVVLDEKSENAQGRYASNFLDITYLPMDNVEIKYNTDYPIQFQYYFGDESRMYFVIAPRVDND